MLPATDLSESAVASDIRTKDELKESSPQPFGPTTLAERLISLDIYRGFVMFLMMAEALRLSRVSRALPESGLWSFLASHQSHVEWIGCSLHDLIQPSFSFAVGVALPFSLAARMAKGQSQTQMAIHAFTRAFILICLGIFLRSVNRPMTYFTFEDTLTQIGLGYGFLFLLGMRSMRAQWIALGVILVGYWLAFALYPAPPADLDRTTVGVSQDWQHWMSGFAAHWNKNTNLAWAFDVWFLNLFPREKPFAFNGGGYATLSFIPTLGTMILGLIAGNVFRSKREPLSKLKWFVIAGVIGLVSGWLIGRAGHLPRREAHLDAELGVVQRRMVLSVDGCVLCIDRRKGVEAMGVSSPRHRDEFDRRLLHRRTAARVLQRNVEDAPGTEQLQSFRRSLRAAADRWARPDCLLGDSVLDVPPENLPANLKAVSG